MTCIRIFMHKPFVMLALTKFLLQSLFSVFSSAVAAFPFFRNFFVLILFICVLSWLCVLWVDRRKSYMLPVWPNILLFSAKKNDVNSLCLLVLFVNRWGLIFCFRYEDLQMLVPNCAPQSDSVSSQKLSKAVILQRSLSYLEFLQQQQKKQADELSKLKKQKIVLTIMKTNYEQIVQQQLSSNNMSSGTVSEEVKFRIFQQLMEKLFVSFNATVSTNDFQELSHGIINWIEEYCKPQTLRNFVQEVLMEINSSQQFYWEMFYLRDKVTSTQWTLLLQMDFVSHVSLRMRPLLIAKN